MKLQILVPQYKETDEVVKPLLDSIALQQGINFDDIGVVIVNDGTDVRLSEKLLTSYPFEVQYHVRPHGGVSATRNACLDLAAADFVMFCDADDMFFNACGLHIVMREASTHESFDSLVSVFVEETHHPETKEVMYINHDMDSTFVHGKVHKRAYLVEKNIRWNDSLTIHEDSYFNILCQNLSQNVKFCPTPFYLWKWRDESICRHDPKYILKTYRNMLDSNDALVDEFLRREAHNQALMYSTMMIFDAYYTMNKPEWINQENAEYRTSTERRFKDYYLKHRTLWEKMPLPDKMMISNNVRGRSIGEGMGMETMTIDDWLNHVMEGE